MNDESLKSTRFIWIVLSNYVAFRITYIVILLSVLYLGNNVLA